VSAWVLKLEHWTSWLSTLDCKPDSWLLNPLLSLSSLKIWLLAESTKLAYLDLSSSSLALLDLASANWASRSAIFLSAIEICWLTREICLGASAALFLSVRIWSEFFWMLSTIPEYWFLTLDAWELHEVYLSSNCNKTLAFGALFDSILDLSWTSEFLFSTRAERALL